MTVEEPSPQGVPTAGRKPWGLVKRGLLGLGIFGGLIIFANVAPMVFAPDTPPAKKPAPNVTTGMRQDPPIKKEEVAEVSLGNLPLAEVQPQDMPNTAAGTAPPKRKVTPISAYNADTPPRPASAPNAVGASHAREGEDDALTAALRPSAGMGGTVAARLMPHPRLTIRAGTDIPCQLSTDINSQLPGIVKCVVPEGIRGSDKAKSVVLIDRGSEIIGQVRGTVAQGQSRIQVIFTEACTPDNVCVGLNSLAGDEGGASGIPGDVDNHVWPRIGLALFVSLIEQAPQAISQAFTNGNGNTYLRFGNGGQNVASQVLQNQINIPPEIKVQRGTWITITAARNLYFPMYDVEVKR